MDYLYINAIVNEIYRDLHCGCPFPSEYGRTLQSLVSSHDCLSNPDIPNVLSYFVLRTKGQTPVMVFSNVQKHTNSASVGRLTQCIGWTWDGDMLLSDMSTLLDAGFYTEEEVNSSALSGALFALPKDRRGACRPVGISMSAPVKQAVLTTVLLRWLRFEAPLRIAVPKGVDYNSYVLSAVKEIYALLPVSLRAKAGFCSYLPNDKGVSDSISIGFVPEEMADSRTLSLDGSSPAACAKLSCGTRNSMLDKLIEYISQAPAESLPTFFAALYADIEGSGQSERLFSVSARDYQIIGEYINLLTLSGTTEAQLPYWLRFYDTAANFPPRMAEDVRNTIRHSTNVEELCRHFTVECSSAPTETFRKLSAYRGLCADNPELLEAMWSTALEFLLSQKYSYTALYDYALKEQASLSPIIDGSKLKALQVKSLEEQILSLSALPIDSPAAVDELKAGADKLQSSIESAQLSGNTALCEGILALQEKLINKQNEFRYAELKSRYDALAAAPAKTVSELNELLPKARELLNELVRLPAMAEKDRLIIAAQKFISEKEALANSGNAKFQIISNIITKSPKYFDIIKALESADTSQLEKQHFERIHRSLVSRRPAGMDAYAREFASYFKLDFTLASVSRQSDYVCSHIIRDICEINKLSLSLPKGSDADAAVQKIDGALHTAAGISSQCSVSVENGGKELDGRWMRGVLRLTHDKSSMGSTDKLEKVFLSLASSGAYSGRDLLPAVEMLQRCGIKQQKLFNEILKGSFRDCSRQQYTAAFDLIASQSEGAYGQVIEQMSELAKGVDGRDRLAYNSLLALKSRHTERRGGKLPMIISIAVAALSLIALVLLLVLKPAFLTKVEEPIPTPTPEISAPVETPAPPAIPENFVFYANESEAIRVLHEAGELGNFAAQERRVSEFIDSLDEDTARQLLELFAEKHGVKITIDGGGTYTAWDEYFFWLCWFGSSDGPEAFGELMSRPEQLEEVCSILRVIRHVKSANADELSSDVDSEEGREYSIDEVKALIAEAAAAPYDAAAAKLEELDLICTLFAHDFSLDFAQHAAQVRSLGLTEKGKAAEYKLLAEHYRSLPAEAALSFESYDFEARWSEYVFWECWLISRQENAHISAESFDGRLQPEVLRILNIIHCLSGGYEVPAAAPELPADGSEGSASEVEGTELLDEIISGAAVSYEQARSAYSAIYSQANEK